jgi:hypothetical protein
MVRLVSVLVSRSTQIASLDTILDILQEELFTASTTGTHFFLLFLQLYLQLTVYRNFKRLVCPSVEKSLRKHKGTCPSRLTGTVSDIVPMIFGLGFENVLLSRLAKEVTPSYMNLNLSQHLGTGECRSARKAVAAE